MPDPGKNVDLSKPIEIDNTPHWVYQEFYKKPTKDLLDKSGAFTNAYGNTDFGNSKYDNQNIDADYIENSNYNNIRGEKQSIAEKWGIGLSRAAIKLGTRTLNGVVSPIYGVGSALKNWDVNKLIDNDVTRFNQKIEENLDNEMPLYSTQREKDATGLSKLAYFNTWAGSILDGISYSGAAMLSGGAYTKVLGAASKLASFGKLGVPVEEAMTTTVGIENAADKTKFVIDLNNKANKLKDGLNNGVISLIGASTEASSEAMSTGDEFERQMLAKIKVEKGDISDTDRARVKELKKSVMNSTYALQIPVIAGSNWFTFGKTMLGSTATEKLLVKTAARTEKDAITQTYKASVTPTLQKIIDKSYGFRQFTGKAIPEGFEEWEQLAVTKGVNDYYSKKYYNPTYDDFYKSMASGINEAMSQEGLENFIVGAISGGIFGNATKIKVEGLKSYKNPINDESVNKALEYLNEIKGSDAFKSQVQMQYRHANLAEQQDNALAANDDFEINNNKSDMFINYVNHMVNAGKTQDLKDELESYKQISNQEFEEILGIKLSKDALTNQQESVNSYIQKRLNKIDKIEQLSNTLDDLHPNLDQGIKDRFMYTAWTLEDAQDRVKNLTKEINFKLSDNLTTANVVAVNVLQDFPNLSKEERKVSLATINSSLQISPLLKQEILKKVNDLDKLVDRQQQFIAEYKALENPKLQAKLQETDQVVEDQVNDAVHENEVKETNTPVETPATPVEGDVVSEESQPASNEEIVQYLGDKIINRKVGEQFTPEEQQYYENNKSAVEAYVASKAKSTTPNQSEIEAKKADIERRKQALRDLMKATGDDIFMLGVEDGTFMGESLLNMNENGDVVLTRYADSEEGLTKGKGKTKNLKDIAGQFGGEQIATSGVEGGLTSFASGVVGEYHIPLQELIDLIKSEDVVFAGLGNKEFVLSPHIADKYLAKINGKQINAKYDAELAADEQNSHLEAIDTVDKTVDSLNKQDHVVEINNFKTSLESIKGLSNYETFSDELKNRLDSTLSKINNLLVATDDNHDIVNDTSNDTTTVVTQNTGVQTNTSLGLQNGIINPKSFSSKVYNAVMMKLFESHYVANKGFQFIKNNEGEAIRTSTLTSMIVNDPSIVKTGDLISFELVTLPENQEQDNLANINTSKKIISDDKSGDYTNEDKEFGKYYSETIGIRHKESNELIGFVAIPHAINVSEVDDEKSILAKKSARKALIEQRKKIIDLLDDNKTVETKIFEKGPGKLLLKSNKDGVPVMSNVISRDQDLIDGRDIFVIDKGYDENGNIEGFVIPNSDNFNKTKDKVKISEINNNLVGRTFSDKEGNNKGRIFKAVKNANGSWSLIPVYSTNIGLTKAQSLVNRLKKFVTSIEDGFTVDLKTVYKELGKDIYITNTDKRGSLKIDKFTINGRPWGALLNNKSFEENLVDHISKSKNNITTQLLNVDNTIKNILETNAYQEEGQYFVQPYIEFEGFLFEDKPVEATEVSNDKKADIEKRRQEELTKIIQSIFPNTQLNEIVYHGTRTQDKFDTFDENKIGELDSGYFGRGFYFSPDKSYAEGYSKQYNGYTIAAILNLQNPLETDANKANTNISLENNDGAIVRVGENLSPELNTTEYDANEIGEVVVKNSNQIHILSEKELNNIDKINAKYDAELAALESPQQSNEEAKKADIEKRRQEELSGIRNKEDQQKIKDNYERNIKEFEELSKFGNTLGEALDNFVDHVNNTNPVTNLRKKGLSDNEIDNHPEFKEWQRKQNLLDKMNRLGAAIGFDESIKEQIEDEKKSISEIPNKKKRLSQQDIDKINAKYDAELDALAKIVQSTTTIEDKLDLNDDVSSIGTIIDEEVFSRNKEVSPLDRDKISKYLRDKLPGLILADEKTVYDMKPFVKDAVGMFYKSTIYLFNGASNFTAYHEAFHGVFRNMLSVEERTNILSEAKKQFTPPTEEQLNDLSNTLTSETKAKLSKDKLNTVLEQLYYEEQLADAFAEYTDNLDSKSLLGKIKDFFNRIFKVFNLFKRYNEDQITTLFENINTGTFRETSKQSLYNRSINSELLTPAYKKPNNVPLSEFLDRSKSIEDIFYYRFNQQLELGIALDKIRVGDIFAQIKQEYKAKAIEFNKNKDVYRSAVSANVYNNWSNYLDQVIKNLGKRKIKIKVSTAESLDKEGIPDTTNDIVDLDIEEVETGINKSYGQEMTAISGIRSAGDKLKLFLSALPIIENNKVKKDSYGFEQFYDYEKVYYQLEKALLGKQSYEEQYDEVEYLASYKPEMQSVKEALDRLKGEEGELIKKQFRTNFFKQQLKFKLVLFEKDRKSGKYTYKLVDSNRTDIKRSIQDEWENNLIDPSRTKENLVKSSNSEYIIDSKKIKVLQQEFNKSNFSKDYLFNTLYRLGIEFRKEDFDKIYKTDNKSIINNINFYLNFLEAKSLDILNGQESKTTYKRGREAFEWFINQQTIFNENLFTESFNNVENSVVYIIQNNSFSSRLLNKLTQGNTDNFIKNLKRDPIYKYLSVLENPYVTKTLQSYAIDGLKDGVGENEGKKYRSIHPNDYTAMAIAAYINSSGNQSLQGISTAIYTPIVPSEKTQAFLNQGPKYSGFIISNDRLIETEDTQRFNKIFWLEADRIKQAIKDKELYESETQLIKDNKLKVRTFNPNPNYHGKNFNGNAYNFNILNYSKALSKDGELYSKIFSEFSGSNLSAQEFFGTSGKYKSEITNEVLTVLNNKYKEQLDSLIASGIIKQSTEGVLSSKVIDLADFDTTISETDKLKNLVAGFSLNTSLFNIEYSLLMNGDPAYYKNSSDWGKRFYQSQAATSSYDSTDFKDGKIQIMAFNDIEQPASKESYDDIISLTKDLSDADITKSILDNDYNKEDSINVADAQFYVSPLLYEKLERSQGKITKKKTKALEIANGSTQGINSKDYHQQIGIMKTFIFGVEWNDKLTRYEPKQIKCAVLPLTESLVADNPLLKKALDKMLSNPDGPQAMALKSTFKALQPSYQNIDNIDSFDMNKVVDLEVENMGLQVDNPNHGLDSENSSTRQLKMLFYGMLDNDTIYGGKKGLDIKNELQQLESKNNLEALNNLVALFANKDERLLKMIGEAITKRNATSIIEKVFDIDTLTGDFRFPLDTLPTRQTIELLSSIFTNNIVLQEFKGGAMVQATSLGFQFKSQFKTLEEQQELVEDTKELKDLQTSLKWIRKENDTTIDYIEVALPYYYSDFLDNNGQFKKDIPEELLRIIGYRIPTEGAHSMLPLKVVKFLPKEYGNVILLPYEITKQMGADFDFDKIYFLSRDYYNKGQKLKPYKYDISDTGLDTRYEQYINSVLNTNKEALQAKKEARADAKELNKISKEAGEEVYKYTFQDDINLLVEEGYIVSKEEFAAKPIEDQLTKEARNNRILDLYTSVLRDVNTLNSLIAPSGPGSISDVYDQVAQYKESEVGDYFSFVGQLKIKKLFDDIIDLKGQSALKVTGHAFVSLGNLEAVNNPFKYKQGDKVSAITNLSKIKSNVGGKIVEELSSMMAAILDAVKTPTMLPYLNISSKTINVWSTIVRFGMGTKVASEFTSQEAIGLVSEKLMDNDKQIKDDSQFNNKVVEETFNIYKDKFLNLYNNFDVETISQQFFGKIIDSQKELTTKLNENIVDLDQLSRFAGKSEQVVKDLIKKDTSLTRENKIKELMSFYLTQMQTLKSFENLEDLSKRLQQVDSIFGLNKQVGPTFETVNGKQEVINEVYNYEYNEEDGMGVFNGIQDLLNEPIINSYININKNFMSLLNQKFGFANDYYNNIKNIIGSGLNVKNDRGLLGIKPEDRDKINSFIFSYLDAYSTMEKEYSQSPEQSGFTDKEFIDEITKLKSEKFDENYQWKIFGNRKMKPETKAAISNSTLIQHLKTRFIKNSDIKTISLKGNRLELAQKEKIIDDFNKFYKNEATKPMVEALVKHSFKYSGFYTGLNSYHNLIDPSILQDMGFITNRGIIKEIINSDTYNPIKSSTFISRMIDQLIRNNPKMTKTFDLALDKGSSLFTESTIDGQKMFLINEDSKHSRASELFKVSKEGDINALSYIRIYLSDETTGFKGSKLYKLVDLNEVDKGYIEVSKLGVPGNLVEVNPYFDLEKSVYQPNNYVKFTKPNEELTQEEQQSVEGENNIDTPVKTTDQLLEEELDNSYNKQKQIPESPTSNPEQDLPDNIKPC